CISYCGPRTCSPGRASDARNNDGSRSRPWFVVRHREGRRVNTVEPGLSNDRMVRDRNGQWTGTIEPRPHGRLGNLLAPTDAKLSASKVQRGAVLRRRGSAPPPDALAAE
ncbi:MAG: hypothetical protein ACM3W7_10840, partial [Acidobacteriota bacterium]